MNTVSRVAFDNMKYNKSKNILTGIAIFLTTLLLFTVPSVGKAMIDTQYATVNKYYPSWHALYGGVDSETVKALSVHDDIGTFGLKCDVGVLTRKSESGEDTYITLTYVDENAAKLCKSEVLRGEYPQKENEIALSQFAVDVMKLDVGIGDKVLLPYQIRHSDGLDYIQKKEFVISGFIEGDSTGENAVSSGIAYVSKAFAESEIPQDELRYSFLFQVANTENATTDDVEYTVENIAREFSIDDDFVSVNTSYLGANYVDPAISGVVFFIMAVVVFAGIITVYSIYYVSMSQRVREFGRLKAIGTEKRQIKQIVLREGMFVASASVPLGLIAGTGVTKVVLMFLLNQIYEPDIISEQNICIYHPWIYIGAAAIAFATVYVSLLKSMKIASRVSAVEAMRYSQETKKSNSKRKMHKNVTVVKLAMNNIFGNKKKTAVTIISMSITGVFVMVVATVLACTGPEIITDADVNGQYTITLNVENDNKEHPELAWNELQKNNPLNGELKAKIESLNGVKRVDAFSSVDISGEVFSNEGFGEDICGVPEEYAEELEKGITEGKVTYEELKSGEKVIIDKSLLYWNPHLKVGDTIGVTVNDSGRFYKKELKIAAIGDYRGGLLDYNYVIMAKDAADRLVSNNGNLYFCVFGEEDYNETLYTELATLCDSVGGVNLVSRKSVYELNKSGMTMLNSGCYAFLIILSVICIMNLVNTMINSIHLRKKELGMIQAIGMSDAQLRRMLLAEGMFYTLGTLAVTLGLGSTFGYLAFLWAKEESLFRIREFFYPWEVALISVAVLVTVQVLLVVITGKSVKKESLIDRIRFSD